MNIHAASSAPNHKLKAQETKAPEAIPFSQALQHAAEEMRQVHSPEESQKQRFKEKKLSTPAIEALSEEDEEKESVYKTVSKIKEKIKYLVQLEQKHLGL